MTMGPCFKMPKGAGRTGFLHGRKATVQTPSKFCQEKTHHKCLMVLTGVEIYLEGFFRFNKTSDSII